MGINIPNVRLIIHYNCPKNMESYYQEIGRAGRDNKASECVLFYSKKDFIINKLFLKTITSDEQRIYQENQIRLIEKYVFSSECRRKLILMNFGQKIESCDNCDNCINSLANLKNDTDPNTADYTKEIYLLLNALYKIDNKFGSGSLIALLIGRKNIKVKDYMYKFEEYGSGTSFGNENWWKELIRILINEDYLIENQIKGSFGATLAMTNKGKTLRNKLNSLFPNYTDLVLISKKITIDNNDQYSKIKLMFKPIIITSVVKSKTNNKPKTKIKNNYVNTTVTNDTFKELNLSIQDIDINTLPTTFLKHSSLDESSISDESLKSKKNKI
jgi:superfamily II DNA helicase RecQ